MYNKPIGYQKLDLTGKRRMAKKIVLIEDEPQIVAVVRGYLVKAGFEVLRNGDLIRYPNPMHGVEAPP